MKKKKSMSNNEKNRGESATIFVMVTLAVEKVVTYSEGSNCSDNGYMGGGKSIICTDQI